MTLFIDEGINTIHNSDGANSVAYIYTFFLFVKIIRDEVEPKQCKK